MAVLLGCSPYHDNFDYVFASILESCFYCTTFKDETSYLFPGRQPERPRLATALVHTLCAVLAFDMLVNHIDS